MDIGALLIILALVIVAAGFIARPLLEKQSGIVPGSNRHDSELQEEVDQILVNLQELDMDHDMGKIPPDEYERRRTAWVARGAAILRELDRLDRAKQVKPTPGVGEVDQNLRDLEDQIEKEILQRRGTVKEGTARFCPQCGNKLYSGDRFCTRCGFEVNVVKAEA